MKFLPLLLANLGRHKRRTILTTLSVALALFLFASLRTVVTTLRKTAEFGGADRLVSDALGMRAVIVEGTPIRIDGHDAVDAEGPLPGRVLRGGK